MKTFAPLVLLAIFLLTLSQARTNAIGISEYHQHSVSKAVTVTKSGLVRVMSRAQRRILAIIDPESANDDDSDGGDDLVDIHVAYTRPRLAKPEHDIELSDYVKIRLMLARHRALLVHKNRYA